MKKELLEKLEKENGILRLVPTIDYDGYSFVCTELGLEALDTELDTPIMTPVTLRAIVYSETGENIVGQAILYIIHASEYKKETFMTVDCEDGEVFSTLEGINYNKHASNWKECGFHKKYEDFLVMNRLFIEDGWRNLGIGTIMVTEALNVINTVTRSKMNVMALEAVPLSSLWGSCEGTTIEDGKDLMRFFENAGCKKTNQTFGTFYIFSK